MFDNFSKTTVPNRTGILAIWLVSKLLVFAVFIGFSRRLNQKVGGKNLFYHIEKGT